MDARLALLVQDYLSAVATAVRLLAESGIPLPESNVGWAANDIPQTGLLHRRIKYFKHGYGCAVQLPGGSVDFDFGAHGETNGFDAWRLSSFADNRLVEYGFASETELNQAFEQAAAAGEFVYSGYILYYPRNEA